MEQDKLLKILFISSDKFPPFRVDVSILFGKELNSRGYKIDWLLQSEKPLDKNTTKQWGTGSVYVGATDNGNSRLSRFKKHFLGLVNDLKVFTLAKNNKYDFILVKDKFLSALLAILATRLNSTRFVYWLSYPFPEASLYQAKTKSARYPIFYILRGLFFKWLLYKIIMPKAVHVFVQSEQMKIDVMTMGIAENKLTAVPMGVALENIPYDFKSTHAEIEKSDQKIVLYLGTLAKVRHMDFLLHVFKKVAAQIPDCRLYFVGGGDDPSDEDFLQAETKRLGLQKSVVFTGFLPMDKAWNYVRMATVCVSPFYPTPILNSTSPTKLVEYMAMGKPTVANDHPEQRLVIEESNAGICVPYDQKAFADAVIQLLESPTMREEMGKRGRDYVINNRSYRVIADIVDNKFRQLSIDTFSD